MHSFDKKNSKDNKNTNPMSKKYWEYFNKEALILASEQEQDSKDNESKKSPEEIEQEEFLTVLYNEKKPLYYNDLKGRDQKTDTQFSKQILSLVFRIRIIESITSKGKGILAKVQSIKGQAALTDDEKQLVYPAQAIVERTSVDNQNLSEAERLVIYQNYLKKPLTNSDLLIGNYFENILAQFLQEDSRWTTFIDEYFSPARMFHLQEVDLQINLLEFGKKTLEGFVFAISQPDAMPGLVEHSIATLNQKIGACGPGMVNDLEEIYSPFVEGLQKILYQIRTNIAKKRANDYLSHFILTEKNIREINQTHAVSQLMNPIRKLFHLTKNRDRYGRDDVAFVGINDQDRKTFTEYFSSGFDVILHEAKTQDIQVITNERKYCPILIKKNDGSFVVQGRSKDYKVKVHDLKLTPADLEALNQIDFSTPFINNSDLSSTVVSIIKQGDFYFSQLKFIDATIDALVNHYKGLLDVVVDHGTCQKFFKKLNQLCFINEKESVYFAIDRKSEDEKSEKLPAYLPKHKLKINTEDKLTDNQMRDLLRTSIYRRLTKGRALASAQMITVNDEACDVISTPIIYKDNADSFVAHLEEKSQTRYSYVIEKPPIEPNLIVIKCDKAFNNFWFRSKPTEAQLLRATTYAIVRSEKEEINEINKESKKIIKYKAYRLTTAAGRKDPACAPVTLSEEQLNKILLLTNDAKMSVSTTPVKEGSFAVEVEIPEALKQLQHIDNFSIRKIYYVDKTKKTVLQIGDPESLDAILGKNLIEFDAKASKVQDQNKDRIMAEITTQTKHHHAEMVYFSESATFVEQRVTNEEQSDLVSFETYFSGLNEEAQVQLYLQFSAKITTPMLLAHLPSMKGLLREHLLKEGKITLDQVIAVDEVKNAVTPNYSEPVKRVLNLYKQSTKTDHLIESLDQIIQENKPEDVLALFKYGKLLSRIKTPEHIQALITALKKITGPKVILQYLSEENIFLHLDTPEKAAVLLSNLQTIMSAEELLLILAKKTNR